MELTSEEKEKIIRILQKYQHSILESEFGYDKKELDLTETIIYKIKATL